MILLVLSIVRSRQCLESEFRAMSGCLDASVTIRGSVSSQWLDACLEISVPPPQRFRTGDYIWSPFVSKFLGVSSEDVFEPEKAPIIAVLICYTKES